MPDLFKGDMLMAFGRYSGKGAAAVKVSGVVNGEKREFVQDVNFVESDTKNAFIPRLWATRRVGWLLDEIRLHGQSQELTDEIVRLAREHGIVTPYTSYLILEDEQRRNVPLSLQTMREMREDAPAAAAVRGTYDSARRDSDRLEKAGDRAVANSMNANSLKDAESEGQTRQEFSMQKQQAFGGAATTQPGGYKVAQNYAQQARVVNGRAFYQNGNVWTDAAAQAQTNGKQKTVAFDTPDYYDLLARHPEASAWFSLGDEVDIVIGDTLYSVRNNKS